MFFSVLFCTVRLSIFERFVFASFEPLRFCKKVRFVFPDLYCTMTIYQIVFSCFIVVTSRLSAGHSLLFSSANVGRSA